MKQGSWTQFGRDQRGAVLLVVAGALATVAVLGVLSIDVGTLAVTRTQLQNAADAGALAAGVALGLHHDPYLATARAIHFAGLNEALVNAGEQPFNRRGPVVIGEADVTFPHAGHVRVQTHRTLAHGDPLRSYFLRLLDPGGEMAEMSARATAGFFWVCATQCLKPWSVPDRWFDADGDGTYNPDPVDNPTEYYDAATTGYNDGDLGIPIVLKLANDAEVHFGQFWYYPVDYPALNRGEPVTGGSAYWEWIAGCPDPLVTVGRGDSLQIEPGNKVGPTRQGVAELIAQDPAAYWDEAAAQVAGSAYYWDAATGGVAGSAYAVSLRITRITLFDPSIGLGDDLSGRKYVVVRDLLALFLEGQDAQGAVIGRFLRLGAPDGAACGDQAQPAFLYKVSLVE
ncbi:MAG: pilus assembly protein TadG-related protein [Candidatus Latescibacterota bacterium]